MNRSISEFAFQSFIFLQHVFLMFKVVFRKLVVDLTVPFSFIMMPFLIVLWFFLTSGYVSVLVVGWLCFMANQPL